MRYRLKNSTAKKLREQLYLGLFFGFVIWVLMAFLFIGDSRQTVVLYLAGSAIIIPYLYKKHVKPFFDDLNENMRTAFIERHDHKITYNHFHNFKQFGQSQIEIKIADIIHIKKAFRKDDTVNKITLTLKNPGSVKIVIENFENMEELLEFLTRAITTHQNQNSGSSTQGG